MANPNNPQHQQNRQQNQQQQNRPQPQTASTGTPHSTQEPVKSDVVEQAKIAEHVANDDNVKVIKPTEEDIPLKEPDKFSVMHYFPYDSAYDKWHRAIFIGLMEVVTNLQTMQHVKLSLLELFKSFSSEEQETIRGNMQGLLHTNKIKNILESFNMDIPNITSKAQ